MNDDDDDDDDNTLHGASFVATRLHCLLFRSQNIVSGNPKLLDTCSSSIYGHDHFVRKKTRASTRLFAPYFEHKTFISGHSDLGSLFYPMATATTRRKKTKASVSCMR
jgi:hypothetical protein